MWLKGTVAVGAFSELVQVGPTALRVLVARAGLGLHGGRPPRPLGLTGIAQGSEAFRAIRLMGFFRGAEPGEVARRTRQFLARWHGSSPPRTCWLHAKRGDALTQDLR